MTDATFSTEAGMRETLLKRRATILGILKDDTIVPRVGTPSGDYVLKLRAEIGQIDTALSQLLVAEAQREATRAQEDATAAQRSDTELREASDARKVDADFWFRRFITSLAIANSAAFIALAGALLQSDRLEWLANLVAWPLAMFAAGLVIAGLVPLILFLRANALDVEASADLSGDLEMTANSRKRHQHWTLVAYIAAVISAVLFLVGLILGLMEVHGIASVP